MMGQLIRDLGFLENTSQYKVILRGDYTLLDNIDTYMVVYIKAWKKPTLILNLSKAIITTEVFQQGWKKIKECTSVGLSGIYFGHLKSCTLVNKLVDFEAMICHIPHATGYCPTE